MNGKFILVSGVSGAGKTTLIAAALMRISALQYLKTYTTRPKRDDENEQSHEYIFVSDDEYNLLRSSSEQWDHTEYNGFCYGADAVKIKQLLKQGVSVICAIAPDKEILETMSKFYDTAVVSIWVNTPHTVARERIKDDKLRSVRKEGESAKKYFGHVFSPKGILAYDQTRFVTYIKKIICSPA